MKNLVLTIVVSLLLSVLLFFCHRDDISQVRKDYQAYQHKNLLPEEK